MKVSVVVPLYNTRSYLDKCLDSLCNQTLSEIEIIVINDGSKEEVEDIIEKYKNKIIYVKNTNYGIGYTRNLGIKMATGEYIGFVDSDDYVDYDMYDDYYNYAKENDLDVLIANYFEQRNGICSEYKIKPFEISNIYDNKEILVDINYGPVNKLYKRQVVIDNNILFEENLKYEDMPFVLKMLKVSKKIGYTNKAHYNYVVRESSETTTLDNRSFDIFKIFDIVNDFYKDDIELKEEIEFLNVSKLLDYNILQRNQKNKKIRNGFIDKSFEYITSKFPNYKKNMYLKKEKLIKRLIKQNKIITKIYCFIYPKRAKYGKMV